MYLITMENGDKQFSTHEIKVGELMYGQFDNPNTKVASCEELVLASSVTQMREALEFYANKENWKRGPDSQWADQLIWSDCAMYNAGGGRARLALRDTCEANTPTKQV